ncbi:hypothetical protein JHK87_023717 [Glycine soja]|nr:hypothetical protein JHK87_023717 [Glycine soja]
MRENTPRETTRVQPPLLSGLPDDLAIACLIRVPRIEHRKLHLVCKRWHRLLSEDFFYSLRKSLGMAEEWLYVIKADRAGRISVHAFDPIYQLWQPLPPVPGDFPEAMWVGSAVLSGCHLYLFGGVDLEGSRSIRRVIFYNACTNKWHRAPDMLQKRNLFRSCVINNCLFVAGGELEGIQMTRSAEVYDPSQNRWSFISEMRTSMVPLFGFVHNGTWFFKGNEIGSGNSMCEAYSPETDTWTPVTNGMVNGRGNDCISLNGQLYALGCPDGCKLTVYDRATDSWKKLIDSKLHVDKFPSLVAVAPVSLNGKLCIIRHNMSISLVDVSSPNQQLESNPQDLWENIAGKAQHIRRCYKPENKISPDNISYAAKETARAFSLFRSATMSHETCPSVKNVLLLDSDGKRVAVKYFSEDWATNSAKENFEKVVFNKTQKTNARTEAEIAMFENNIVVYKFVQDLHFFVTGGDYENELILATVLQAFFDSVGLLLRGNVDKKEALENLDLILLCIDEIVDGGIILETDPNVIAGKVASNSIDSGAPLSEQTLSQALATAREHLARSLLK